MGKAEARALAANYMSRIVDPVINPATGAPAASS